MTTISTPSKGKLIHEGIEVILYAYGEIENEVITPLSNIDNYTATPGINPTPRLTHRLEKHIMNIYDDLKIADTLPEAVNNVMESDYIFTLYNTENGILVVTPKLRTIYSFSSKSLDEPVTFATTIEESPPLEDTPVYELIGSLIKPDNVADGIYDFTTSGWKMKLKRKHNQTVTLTEAQPEQIYQYHEI